MGGGFEQVEIGLLFLVLAPLNWWWFCDGTNMAMAYSKGIEIWEGQVVKLSSSWMRFYIVVLYNQHLTPIQPNTSSLY